ncbi:hypothetical protein KKC74_15010, partial [bacterium]|nr:hypothetical protein [bacterium]
TSKDCIRKMNYTINTRRFNSNTGFQELAELENSKLMNQMSLMGIMTAEEVATITYNKFMKGKRIIIPGIMNKVGVFANRLFSRKFMTKVIHKMQESR